MSTNYTLAVKTARMEAVRALAANGTFEICSAGYSTVLVVFGLDATAGSVANGVWTVVLDDPSVAPALAGTAAVARIKNSVGTVLVDGLTVGTTGTDVVLGSTTISLGIEVDITSFTVTHV